MKYLFFVTTIILALFSSAQDCTKELLRQKTGTWKAGMKGSIVNVSATDLIKEKAITAGIHKMVSSNYKPMGCQISYSTVFGKIMATGQTRLADPYYYSMYILRYLCDQQSTDKSKYYVDAATPTTVNITANVIFSLNSLYAADMSDDFRGIFKTETETSKKRWRMVYGRRGSRRLWHSH